MISVDITRLDLKPGIHLVLARHASDPYRAIQQVLKALKADTRFVAIMGSASFSLDRQRRMGYVATFGQGQHYADIDACYAYLRTRDDNASHAWLVDTMNPWVVDRLAPESKEDLQRRLFFVRNGDAHVARLDDEEARRVWTAYEAGIQHLSEILIGDGLW